MDSKKDIRKRVLEARERISKEKWEENSHKIFQKLAAHPFFLNAKEVYCYVDFRKEVGTRKLIEEAWRLQKKVAVPRIQNHEMDFYYIDNFSELEEGYFGVMEPITSKKADGKDALIIMPGAAFDKNRNRIGYGKGYYDRYLRCHPLCHTIAIAFELQIVDEIPSDAYDICPEMVITEENEYV